MDSDRDDVTSAFLLQAKAAWAVFDAAFYAAANPAARPLGDAALLLAHYLAEGAAGGFSPNRWFDEAFYRRSNPDVDELIRCGSLVSGFAHYCRTGSSTRAPHWLFDPACYAEHNPALTEPVLKAAGFVNAYDHYLKHGAAEQRLCHRYFDPAAYTAALDPQAAAACKAMGAFQHFLVQSWTGTSLGQSEPRVSPHFDPVWYKAAYPEAAEAIRAALWHSALHHYLAHRAEGRFRPLPPVPELSGEAGATQRAAAIKIHIDRPAYRGGEALEPIDGHLDVVGWAAANHPVEAVDVYVDGEHCGRARHGIRTEGVAAAFPTFTDALFAGFRFIAPAPAQPGRHHLRIVARDASGEEASAEFAAVFKPAILDDGPWCLRRRMRGGEAGLMTRLLEKAAFGTDYLVVLTQAPGVPEAAMQRTLASLDRQVFARWRLHDASLSVDSLSTAADSWLVPVTPGDELGVDALLEFALHRLAQPGADFIYSDERRTDPNTGGMAPFFKPDWSPDLLLATDYIGRLWTAHASLFERAGIAAPDLADHDNHDLVLRLTECAESIGHVSLVLCESAAHLADAGAVQRALARRGMAAKVEPGLAPQSWRIRHGLGEPPRVSVIIPTAGARGLIAGALRMLREQTAYPALEVIVIDTVPGAEAPWKADARGLADQVLEGGGPFNWSRLNNLAARHASGEVLLFLNDDVALPADGDIGWLHTMVEQLACPGVGIVGARLLYPGALVQHAGMFLHRSGGRNAFAGLAGTAPGPFGLALTTRNVSAVTGACLLVGRILFDQLGGFDERLDVACNDADFCLRALHAGWRVVATPHATLIHHESVTRTGLPEAHNEALFAQTWRGYLAGGDPFFSRHLAAAHTDWRPDPEFVEAIYPSRPLAAPETIRRILVIKLDHIGDFLLALPAIRALKRFFGEARLTLLAAPGVVELTAGESAIDDTLAFDLPLRGGSAAPAPLGEIAEALVAREFDLAVDLRCHGETRPILQASGATWRAGFDQAHDFPWLDIAAAMEPDTAGRAKRTHMSETLLNLAAKITAAFTPASSPFMGEGWGGGSEGRARTRAPWPADLPPPPPGVRRIAIHPAAGTAIKRWPAAHFVSLIDQLAEWHDACFVLLGTAEDAPLADAIIAAVRPSVRITSAAGGTSLPGLARLLAACDFFIGNDSGPAHLAASLGLPTLAIHSGVVDGSEWSPASPAALALRRRMRCSPCYLADAADCPRSVACLNELTPAAVLDNVKSLTAAWKIL
jgi:ADP-heptose:LPS heptosyltransferase/GT2 family glycosyltransferase